MDFSCDRAYHIHINGIVQGVGFRPFVFKLAKESAIKGWVNNTSDGLDIHAEGENIEIFCQRLIEEKPPLAVITSFNKEKVLFEGFADFKIIHSKKNDQKNVLISPDVATCQDCINEMMDEKDRRYHYPFINCTNCGPRYTIIQDRPYDREKTTMDKFPMCAECKEEYENPLDRRFHAQPVACVNCGPKVSLHDAQGNEIIGQGLGIDLLAKGAIFAIKGLGGFHLVCDAYNELAVKRLRKLKERGSKPFALMSKNIERASQEVDISNLEKEWLCSPAAPIVLLQRKYGVTQKQKLSSAIAPGLHSLGIMLPYTPLHHLLFEHNLEFLVMTSANLSGQPLIYENQEALQELKEIADYFLIHDREIYHPCDDSVIQMIDGKMTFIRRARGYVPLPLFLQDEINSAIAGLGGEMKNAFCLACGNMAFMSQYIGDMHGYENLERYKQEFNSYQKVANVFPEIIAYDMHPEYATTKLAEKIDKPKFAVQHHHAHHVSVMGEYNLTHPMLGLICDGTGYGDDGNIWGFEFLYANASSYKRQGHLEYLPLPGGDAGAKFPRRIAYAYLRYLFSEEEWSDLGELWKSFTIEERKILEGQLKAGFQVFKTSSAGRLFDAVSGLLGICTHVSYEGQAAIELESTAFTWLSKLRYKNSRLKAMDYHKTIEAKAIEDNNPIYPVWLKYSSEGVELKVDRLFYHLVQDLLTGVEVGEIAYKFHLSLAKAMLETALTIGIGEEGMLISGGVFQNKLLSEIFLALAREKEIKVYYPQQLPAGDGGLAFGQILVANSMCHPER